MTAPIPSRSSLPSLSSLSSLSSLLALLLLSLPGPLLAQEPPDGQPSAAPSPYALFTTAAASLAASNYAAAADTFAQAAAAAPSANLSPAQALFDQGIALQAAGDPAASGAFLEAARSPNAPLPLQARSFYNAGNLLLRRALEAHENPAPPVPASPDGQPSAGQNTSTLLQSSLASLQNAIELDPANLDAKASYELATRLQQQLQQEQQQPEGTADDN